jgi:hypothetical protein
MYTNGALANSHEFKQGSNELLQFLRTQPCSRLTRQEGRADTQNAAVYL